MTLEETFGNIVSMTELAKANNIKVVISSGDRTGRNEKATGSFTT
jgi:hypothetical protein